MFFLDLVQFMKYLNCWMQSLAHTNTFERFSHDVDWVHDSLVYLQYHDSLAYLQYHDTSSESLVKHSKILLGSKNRAGRMIPCYSQPRAITTYNQRWFFYIELESRAQVFIGFQVGYSSLSTQIIALRFCGNVYGYFMHTARTLRTAITSF